MPNKTARDVCKSAAENYIAENPIPDISKMADWMADYGAMILASWAEGTQIARNRTT